MVIIFDLFGAAVAWLCLFKPQLLGTLTTAPLGATLSGLTFFDVAAFALCLFVVALLTRLAEKHMLRKKAQ